MTEQEITQNPAEKLASSIDDRKTRYLGYLLVAMFLAIFVLWGNLVPLKSAAIAKGTVSVAGSKKTVQHVDGGIVSNIFVKDGDIVHAGQVLITLDSSDATTQFLKFKKQTTQLVAELARWREEQQLQTSINMMGWQSAYSLATGSDSKLDGCSEDSIKVSSLICRFDADEINNAVAEQQNILNARMAVYTNSLASMRHQITETENKERESQGALNNIQQKRRLISTELQRNRELEKQGLVTHQKVFELESELNDIKLSRSEIASSINIAKDQRSRLQSDLLVLENTHKKTATEKTAEVSNKLDEAIADIVLATKTLDRMHIRSPIDGVVIGTQVNTIGSVIAQGDTLMEIVPGNATLLIESQVNLIDRDSVTLGQKAQVRFSAFDRRSSKAVPGVVTLISADKFIEASTNTAYYKTIIELTEDPAIALEGAEIYPGMQADVLIETGEQTFIQYLLSPVSRSFRHAFRES